MVLVIETQIATEETTWTLILEGPSQKFSALQSLATSRQYAPMQLHCTTDVARSEIWQNVAVPSSCPCGPTCAVASPCLDPWARCDIVTRSCDVVVVHCTGTQTVAFVWYNFVTPLLYTLWRGYGTLVHYVPLHIVNVIPPVGLYCPGASVMLAEPADMLLLGRGVAILYLVCYRLL